MIRRNINSVIRGIFEIVSRTMKITTFHSIFATFFRIVYFQSKCDKFPGSTHGHKIQHDEAPKAKKNLAPPQSSVSICKRFFDQIIIIRECWDINSKTLTVFLFSNFIHLPFFSKSPFSP